MQEPVDDIKLRSRAQRKLVQASALQPEDSAEQLSSMPMPSRVTSATPPPYVAQQPALPDDSIPASGAASMIPTEPVRQKVSGPCLPLDLETKTASAQASAAAQQHSEVCSLHDTSVSDSSDDQAEPASSPSAGTAVAVADEVSLAAGTQQQEHEGTSVEPLTQLSSGRSATEVPGQPKDTGLETQVAADLQHAESYQDEHEHAAVQLAQQQGLVPQHGEVAALEHQAMSAGNDGVQASTGQSSRPKQLQGKSVYAARELTVLEKYEADVVHAYATSFVVEAMMQGMLPAAANAVVDNQHGQLLAEVRRRNELNKVRHLEEVQAERAAWEAHEESVKR